MDGHRKRAYRYLLYKATLDIRPLGWLRLRDLFHWRRHFRFVRYCGEVADWLHNLALFLALDFEQFDEDWFWREWDRLKQRHPEAASYRVWFEDRLSETHR